ncbi:MAG: BTAD domain-containing putative transcriptional regulator [Gaiellaceae bacterium]
MSLVEVRLLGPLEVDVAGRRLELRRNKQRAVLALLALRPGEVVSRDRIVDELWGERPPKAAVASLQNVISDLRKALSPQLLVTQAPGYALALKPEAVDARRFEAAVDDAGAAVGPEDRVRLLGAALALWRGEPLADVELGTFAAAEASRLEELRAAAREAQLEAELDLGRHAQLIADLDALAAEYPMRERPTALLMLGLYRAGRQAEALEAYHRARERLVGELGIEPWPELKRLEGAILRQDPALDAMPRTRASVAPAREEDRRKTVTILFADVVDSTALGASLDPEVLRAVMRRYFDVAQRVIERHGGTVEKFIGDAVMAAFGIPSVHEDDALRAVRAARDLRDAIDTVNREQPEALLQIRVGVNTGEVLAAGPAPQGSYATGTAVNVAVRLEEAAMPGEILLGEPTHRLVSYAVDAEPIEGVDLGGALGRVRAFRLLEVGAVPRPLGAASLVGRDDELAVLRAAVAGVRAERRSRVVTVVGEAGMGKTRLLSELIASLASDEGALVGRCASYGEGATFLPLAEIVAQAVPSRPAEAIAALLGADEQATVVAQRVTQLTGDAYGGSTGETFWAVRRFLEALAGEGALVVALDDVHWAEPTLLDLLDYLAAWPAEAPLLLVCLTRPELLEQRPGWGSGRQTLVLEPLEAEAARLVLDQLARVELARRDRERIVQIAEGNPLFLEQLLALADEVGPDAVTRVPPSVEAILAARLDRLERSERALLERAAVVGRECPWKAILQLTPPEELNGVDARLLNLVRRGLLLAERSGSEDAFRFKHVLVRDVAYAGMTKESRIGAHELYADWLEQVAAAPDELVGYHLEQAFHYRHELGSLDHEARERAQHASKLLAAAGRRAPARGDWPAAAALLARATALLPKDSPDRLRLLPDLARAHGRCGDYAAELRLLDEAIERAERSGDRRTRSYGILIRGHARMHVDPRFSVAEELPAVEEARQTFEALGDRRGEARAWARLAYYHWFRGRNVEAQAAEEGTLSYAISVADDALEAEARGFIGSTLLNGPARLEKLFDYARELDEQGRPGRETRMRPLLGLLGVAHAMQGDFDEGRALVSEEVSAYEEVGNHHAAVRAAAHGFGPVELLAGDAAAAEEHWRRGFQALEELGETGHLSTLAARLAHALCALGRYDEAEEYTRISEGAAGRDDYLSQVLWRSARAYALAGRDRVRDAPDLAREAVALAQGTDDLNTTGDALMSFAEVLRLNRRQDEAARAAGEAQLLYERKGNSVMADAARALLAATAESPAL